MPKTAVDREDAQFDDLLDWRLTVLVNAGYSERSAKKLAKRHSEVDLHLAVDLLMKGCPEALALKILL